MPEQLNRAEYQPDNEKEYTGFQGLELSSSAWFFNPQEAFEILDKLNERRVRIGKDPMKLELYVSSEPKLLKKLLGKTPFDKYIPPTTDPEYVRRQLGVYTSVNISDVHDAFNYSRLENLLRATVGEEFLPYTQNGKILERAKLGIKNRFYQGAWYFFQNPAEEGNGIYLAQSLGEIQNPTGLNLHVNVIEGLETDGKLEDTKNKVTRVLAETERPYNHSPHLTRLESEGISQKQLVSDAKTIQERVVKPYHLDGLVLGADHLALQGEDALSHYKDVVETTRKIHIAGMDDTDVHTLIPPHDAATESLLTGLAQTSHKGRLDLVIDANPLLMNRLTPDDQLEILWKITNWMEDTQKGEHHSIKHLRRSIHRLANCGHQETRNGYSKSDIPELVIPHGTIVTI